MKEWDKQGEQTKLNKDCMEPKTCYTSKKDFYLYYFFFYGYGDHGDLHRVDRRQRQMCIRDRRSLAEYGYRLSAIRNRRGRNLPCLLLPMHHYIVNAFGDNLFIQPQYFWLYTLTWRCLLYTSPSPRDRTRSRMPSSA